MCTKGPDNAHGFLSCTVLPTDIAIAFSSPATTTPPPPTHTHTASPRIDDNIREEAEKFDATGKAPSDEVYLKMGAFGALACRLGPGKHLNLVPGLPAGIAPDDFDYFHVRLPYFWHLNVA